VPFKSQAQRRYFHWAESKGKLPKGTSAEWEEHTSKKLPEKVKTAWIELEAEPYTEQELYTPITSAIASIDAEAPSVIDVITRNGSNLYEVPAIDGILSDTDESLRPARLVGIIKSAAMRLKKKSEMTKWTKAKHDGFFDELARTSGGGYGDTDSASKHQHPYAPEADSSRH
jgi:hypothetical protein